MIGRKVVFERVPVELAKKNLAKEKSEKRTKAPKLSW